MLRDNIKASSGPRNHWQSAFRWNGSVVSLPGHRWSWCWLPYWSSISATSRTENFRCTPKTGLCPTAWWWWWHQVTNPPCKAGPPSKTGLHPASCRTSFSPAAFNKGKNSENTRNANCLVKKNIGEHKALNKDTNICSFFQRMLSTHNYLSQWESAGATILWKAGQ